jgi:hypothetical protein
VSETTRRRLLERTFKYVKASDTDVARTFARIRRQQKETEAAQPANVKPIRKVAK